MIRKKLWAYLVLMRPANILTAIADILLGIAASGILTNVFQERHSLPEGAISNILWLVLATVGLYGGGVVMNDVFDHKLDALERPERPIPKGIIPRAAAALWGTVLLLMAVFAAMQVSALSGLIALGIALLALIYDAIAKHHLWLGPLTMGACRGGNLLLGISILPAAVSNYCFLALIPVAYIAMITLISQGEVQGGSRKTLNLAIGCFILVIVAVISLGGLDEYQLSYTLMFLALFFYLVFPALWQARQDPSALKIRKAVKAGVIALIVLDASMAAGFSGWIYGLIVLALLPLSIGLAKLFAVT